MTRGRQRVAITRIPLKLRVVELREAQIYGTISSAFSDLPDLVERTRWATIANIYTGVNLDFLNNQYEFWCQEEADMLVFCVEPWTDPLGYEDSYLTEDEIADLVPL